MIRFKNFAFFVFYLEKKFSVSNPLIEDGKLTEQCGLGHFWSQAQWSQSVVERLWVIFLAQAKATSKIH